jgi:hypothetical protein
LEEERAKGQLDAKAAVEFLAAQLAIDKDRIGLAGVIEGGEHVVGASIGDPSVKALALLTGYAPSDEKERSYLTGGRVRVMYISCKSHKLITETMKQLFEVTPYPLARFVQYDGGATGHHLFELEDKLEPTIVEWLKEGLKQR